MSVQERQLNFGLQTLMSEQINSIKRDTYIQMGPPFCLRSFVVLIPSYSNSQTIGEPCISAVNGQRLPHQAGCI